MPNVVPKFAIFFKILNGDRNRLNPANVQRIRVLLHFMQIMI